MALAMTDLFSTFPPIPRVKVAVIHLQLLGCMELSVSSLLPSGRDACSLFWTDLDSLYPWCACPFAMSASHFMSMSTTDSIEQLTSRPVRHHRPPLLLSLPAHRQVVLPPPWTSWADRCLNKGSTRPYIRTIGQELIDAILVLIIESSLDSPYTSNQTRDPAN